MTIEEFLTSPEWDAPFYKRLAHNDTGAAAGHQGGMVLPKDLRKFLPTLDEAITSEIVPTTDRHLRAEMFVGTTHTASGIVRYQFQTWGGTRPAESRITDGFGPLRSRAEEGDILVFQRRADALDRFRFVLLKKGTREFSYVTELINGRRWGPLFPGNPPVTQSQLSSAGAEVKTLEAQPFQVIKSEIARIESRQSRIARNSVFRELVRREYGRKCAVSDILIVTPTMLHEVESAHVVPMSEGGSDDIRNGITLTQTLHWAFDRGLFGVLPTRKIYLPRQVRHMPENAFLRQFESKQISEAKTPSLRAHSAAFLWHFDNLVRQWD